MTAICSHLQPGKNSKNGSIFVAIQWVVTGQSLAASQQNDADALLNTSRNGSLPSQSKRGRSMS